MQRDEIPRTETMQRPAAAAHRRTRRRFQHCGLAGALVGLVMSACLFKNGGGRTVIASQVMPGALCEDAAEGASGCPSCSTPVEGMCRDRWYDHGWRCTGDAQCQAGGGRCEAGWCVMRDRDRDRLDDDFEQEVAERNLPAILAAPGEACGDPVGVVFRARRHPAAPTRLALTYVLLYDRDCGRLNGHIGDAEPFAITVDLGARPGGTATVAASTWAHFGSACESASSCETAPGTGACAMPVAEDHLPSVVVYSSRNKHASYLTRDICARNCLDECGAGRRLDHLPLLNAGEPGHPLTTDLSSPAGFIRADAGWHASLLHADPWAPVRFGSAGRIDRQLGELLSPAGPGASAPPADVATMPAPTERPRDPSQPPLLPTAHADPRERG